MAAMPYTDQGFEWEVPARVLSVMDGNRILVDADLGFRVHIHAVIEAAGIEAEGMPARKEAQRLLQGADLTLRVLKRGRYGWVCDVAYGPFFSPRSEQASFAAAMLAAGVAKVEEA